MKKNRILDLGCGRDWIQYKDRKDCNIVCVDKLYNHENMVLGGNHNIPDHISLEPHEISSFLENYVGVPFNTVKAYRVFEHFRYDKISYYLYLIYKVTKPGGIVEIIVPNFLKVFEKLQHLENNIQKLTPLDFNNNMIMLHTEIFNETNDPHQSIWTPRLAEYYLTLEGYYEVKNLQENVKLDNRDWYFKVTAETVDGEKRMNDMDRIEDEGPCYVLRLFHPDTEEFETVITAFVDGEFRTISLSDEELEEMRREKRENPDEFDEEE